MAPDTDAAPAVRAPPPNAWASRSARTFVPQQQQQQGRGSGSGAGADQRTPNRTPASRSPAPRSGGNNQRGHAGTGTPSNNSKPAAAAPTAPVAPVAPAAALATAPAGKVVQDHGLPLLQGQFVRLTLTGSSEPTEGVLWAFDAPSAMVVLETKGATAPEDLLVGTPYASAYTTPAQRKADAAAPKATFQLLRLQDVTSATVVASEAGRKPSSFDPVVATPSQAAARKAATLSHVQSKATRIGRDVGWLGQAVFDALDKTLPVRWHETHIIVLDQVVVHGPGYDTASTLVPGYSPEQLTAAADGHAVTSSAVAGPDQVKLPDGKSVTDAKAVANSWNRVIKVLEGERARIFARRQQTAAQDEL